MRDSAAAGMSASLSMDDPRKAWQWAADIEDEELRRMQLEDVGYTWLEMDPEEAQAFIEEADLPDALRKQLLEPDDELEFEFGAVPGCGSGDLCLCPCPGAGGEGTDLEDEEPEPEDGAFE